MAGKYVGSQFVFAEGVCPVESIESVDRVTCDDIAAAHDGTFSVVSYDGYDLNSGNVAVGISVEEDAILLAAAHKEWLRNQPGAFDEFDRVLVKEKASPDTNESPL